MKNFSLKFFLLLFFSGFSLQAQVETLSPQAEISLLTSTPGPLLYQAFGHSAIRVKDPATNLDQVFNYGTFDFNTENFYWKFAKGNLYYSLSIQSFENYIKDYKYYGQTVYEQVFNFDYQEKNKLYKFLQNNHLPANRFYLYDYFQDNCATRIYDIIFLVFAERAELDNISWYQPASYRESIDPYLRNFPWSHLGIDISLGMPTDKEMQPEDFMFLPEYLMLGLQNTLLNSEGYEAKPLIKSHSVLYEGSRQFPVNPKLQWWPMIVLIIFLIVTLFFTYQEIKTARSNRPLDIIIFSLLGLIGVYLTFLWVGTQHVAAYLNADLLWASPLHLIVVYFLMRKKTQNQFMHGYLSLVFLFLLLYLLMWLIDFKNFNWLIIPLLLTYATRLIRWNFFKPTKKN